MSQTLNNAQRKLVEDNHNLIYSFLKNRRLSLDAVEDWYGTAAVGLCKAALAYDEARGAKFSTLAYVCMDNEVQIAMRRNRKCIIPAYSLDCDYGEGNEAVTFAEFIPDSRDCCYSIYLNDAIKIAAGKLSDRDREILNLVIYSGKTNAEIAKLYNLSRSTVSRVYRRFINDVREYFND